MEKMINFLHIHPLTLTEGEEVNDKVVCRGCCKGLSGSIYGCIDCKFYIHKSCTELPSEIQNFFHPCPLLLNITSYICNACFKEGSGFSYRCKGCDFDMHVECAQRPTIKSQGYEKLIHHFTHWHPLKLVDQNKYLEVRCGICEKLYSGSGSGSSAYSCEECNFFVHNSCMINIPRQINHFFHPSCPLILLTTANDECAACDERGSALTFRCGKCRFQLDVKCALLPTVESKDADKIQHCAHNHPLALRKSKEFGNEVRCRACGENCLLDPCFACSKGSCDFFLHRTCAVELPREIHHPFHPLHPLTVSLLLPGRDHDTSVCPSCFGSDDMFLLRYRCAECDFNLHINCAKLKLTPYLKYEGHSHHLTFFDKTHAPTYCQICFYQAQSCFFRCVACNFAIHPYCIPSTPKTIKHKCHLHPLTVTESPFEFELNSEEDESDSDDEFYCDVCEEKRYKFERVYYCAECKFIAEIRCVISELLPSLTISEDQRTMNGRVISRDEETALEGTIAKVNNEIAELRAKEKPLKAEIEKLRATLKTLEEELNPINWRLEKLEADRFLYNYQLGRNMKENKYATEASTSEGHTADLS